MAHHLLLALMLLVAAGCNPMRRFTVQAAPPGTWRQVRAFNLLPIDWRGARIDGMTFQEFSAQIAAERRGNLVQDVTEASSVMHDVFSRGAGVVGLRSTGRPPHLRITVTRWERGYYSFVPKATVLRVRVSLEQTAGRPVEVVDFEATFRHPVFAPHPAAGVRRAAEIIANDVAEWLTERVRQ